tara:strand:+ start:3552 stop:4814 length:1263 start_codon:yes stop_codon:yes gene_type:complete
MAYIGRQLTQGEFIKLDSIQSAFDGSETTFDLKATGQAYSPGAANALLVSLAGVIQESGIAYTVDDSQITFTTAPTSDTEVFILAMGSRVNVGTPSAGTINGSTLVDGSVGANKIAGSSINAAKLNPSFGTYGGTISATAFAGDGSALTGIANTADINAGTLNVAGVTTVGSGITLSPDGDGFFTGVVTATSYAGDGSALTGIAATANVRTGILDVAGIATFRDNIIATTASFSSDVSIAGTVSIGGTLTYEDVTNVDSVGLITARSGIKVGSGITLSSDGDVFTVGVSTFTGNLDALDGVDVTGNITATSNISDTKGNVRIIPKNSQSSSYTLVAADSGKHIFISSGGVTIPASIFDAGDAITIINNSGSDQTITCSAITTYLANDTSTKSSLTLKGRGVCTFIFVGTGMCYGAGAGLE